MVETIATETSFRISQSSCAVTFPMHSWQDPPPKMHPDKEWNNLTSKGAWDYSTVREWDDVSREAIKNKTKNYVGKIFEICVEKGSELPHGSMQGNRTSQGDGKQACTQALIQGILTWIRLPRNRWPKEWIGVDKDPVALLILALYGHPDSGGLWQRHCEKALYAVGFQNPTVAHHKLTFDEAMS